MHLTNGSYSQYSGNQELYGCHQYQSAITTSQPEFFRMDLEPFSKLRLVDLQGSLSFEILSIYQSVCTFMHPRFYNKRSAQERISVIEFRFLSSRTKPLHLSLKDCHGVYFRDTTRKPCRWKLLRGAWLLHRLAAFGNVIGSATVETGLTMPRWQPEG